MTRSMRPFCPPCPQARHASKAPPGQPQGNLPQGDQARRKTATRLDSMDEVQPHARDFGLHAGAGGTVASRAGTAPQRLLFGAVRGKPVA